MPKHFDYDGLTTHILDLLGPWSEVSPRRMFGGIGLFAHGLMFAIIIDDVLYLKDHISEHGEPVATDFDKEYFEYSRLGKTVRLGFFRAPDRALEEGDYLIELVNASYKSASLKRKSAKAKAKKISKPRTKSPTRR
jgi:DNA transformation protein